MGGDQLTDDAEKKQRVGGLPAPVLAKVRKIVVKECAYYLGSKHYCPRTEGGACVFFTDGSHRCGWFEQAVLPVYSVLVEIYWREYGEHAVENVTEGEKKQGAVKIAQEARRVLKEVQKKREKCCEVCKRLFIPDVGKEKSKYCSDVCRRAARRNQDRIRKRKAKENEVKVPHLLYYSSLESLDNTGFVGG